MTDTRHLPDDREALDNIAELLTESEWEAGTLDLIAGIVRDTGRLVLPPVQPWLSSIDHVLEGYVACALWSTSDANSEDTESLDDYDISDIEPATLSEMLGDCRAFINDIYEHLDDLSGAGYAPDELEMAVRIGHDFWLTRNGHGAGFWDRGLGELGNELTEAAKAYGTVDLYVTDEGKVASL